MIRELIIADAKENIYGLAALIESVVNASDSSTIGVQETTLNKTPEIEVTT